MKSKLSLQLVVTLALLTGLSASVLAQNLDLSRWMERLPGTTEIRDLSIPGTHDTMTYNMDRNGNVGEVTQNWSLERQLKSGIRHLDIRCKRESANDGNGAFAIYHGNTAGSRDTGFTFGNVVRKCREFLKLHQGETIIMLVSEEAPPTSNPPPFEEILQYYIDRENAAHQADLVASGLPAQDIFWKSPFENQYPDDDDSNGVPDALELLWDENGIVYERDEEGELLLDEDDDPIPVPKNPGARWNDPEFPNLAHARGQIVIVHKKGKVGGDRDNGHRWYAREPYEWFGPMSGGDHYKSGGGSSGSHADTIWRKGRAHMRGRIDPDFDGVADSDYAYRTGFNGHCCGSTPRPGDAADYVQPRLFNLLFTGQGLFGFGKLASNVDPVEPAFTERNWMHHGHAGIVHMDYPREGVVAAIVAHDFRLASSPYDIAGEWREVVEAVYDRAFRGNLDVSWSRPDRCDERVEQMKSFLDHLLPAPRWNVLCADDNFGFSVHDQRLFANPRVSGKDLLVVGTEPWNVSVPYTAAALRGTVNVYANGLRGSGKSSPERAALLKAHLDGTYPDVSWNVFVKKEPRGTNHFDHSLSSELSYDTGWDDLRFGSYRYVVWGGKPPPLPPLEIHATIKGTNTWFTQSEIAADLLAEINRIDANLIVRYSALNPLPFGLTLNRDTGVISGVPIQVGSFEVVIQGYFMLTVPIPIELPLVHKVNLRLEIAELLPAVSSPSIASGMRKLPFQYQMILRSGLMPYGNEPFSLIAGQLPSGLVLDGSTGEISGTPTESGTFEVTLSAITTLSTQPGTPYSHDLRLDIAEPRIENGSVGVPFAYREQRVGGDGTFSAQALPPGLVIDPSSGEIRGMPEMVSEPSDPLVLITHAATSGGEITGMAYLGIVVGLPPPPVITSRQKATAVTDRPFIYAIVTTGFSTIFEAINLPDGLSIDGTGLISGVPTESGVFTIGLIASNAGGQGTASLALTIVPSSVLVSNAGDSGPGSLREAIARVVAGGTIGFESSLNGQTITLTSGQLRIEKGLTIDASSLPSGITISGSGASRVFRIDTDSEVLLTYLTITGGLAGGDGTGGGIRKTGTGILFLSSCYFHGNNAERGGALAVGASTGSNARVEARGCTFADSRAYNGGGGAIRNFGSLVLENCTFSDNVCSTDGGAIGFNEGGTLIVRHCTITGNRASERGGGIATDSGSGNILVNNSIIAGNQLDSGRPVSDGIDLRLYDAPEKITFSGANVVGSLEGIPESRRGTLLVDNLPLARLADYGGPTPTRTLRFGAKGVDAAPTSLVEDQRGVSRPQGNRADVGAVEGELVNPSPADQTVDIPVGFVVLAWSSPSFFDSFRIYLDEGSGLRLIASDWQLRSVRVGLDRFRQLHTWRVDTVLNNEVVSSSSFSFTTERGDPIVTSIGDDGPGSLRQWMREVLPAETITFAPALSGQTITLESELVVTETLGIDASGLPDGLTLDGGTVPHRLFTVMGGKTLKLEGLNLTGGDARSDNSRGGAIQGESGSTIWLRRCTLRGNRGVEGGALFCRGALDAENCAFTENSAYYGSAIQCYGVPSRISHCTIAGNEAQNGGAVIWVRFTTLTLENSIVAGNTGLGSDIFNRNSTLNYTGKNLVQSVVSDDESSVEGETPLFGEPLLAPLGRYGGPTLTMPAFPTSAAIDAATAVPEPARDQRGLPREVGAGPDIGAVEFQGGSDLSRFWQWDFDQDQIPFGLEFAIGSDQFTPDGDYPLRLQAFSDEGGLGLRFGVNPEAVPYTVWTVIRSFDLSEGNWEVIYRFDGSADEVARYVDDDLRVEAGGGWVRLIDDTVPQPSPAFYQLVVEVSR